MAEPLVETQARSSIALVRFVVRAATDTQLISIIPFAKGRTKQVNQIPRASDRAQSPSKVCSDEIQSAAMAHSRRETRLPGSAALDAKVCH